MTTENPGPDDRKPKNEAPGALAHLAQRLKSQPLLLALGVVIVLAPVATTSVEGLRALLPATVAIAVVAIVAWTTVELVRRARAGRAAGGEDVQVSAKRVARTGEVIGVDDAAPEASGGNVSVKLDASDIQGRVVGVRRGPKRR
jgi:hypothetical protein